MPDQITMLRSEVLNLLRQVLNIRTAIDVSEHAIYEDEIDEVKVQLITIKLNSTLLFRTSKLSTALGLSRIFFGSDSTLGGIEGAFREGTARLLRCTLHFRLEGDFKFTSYRPALNSFKRERATSFTDFTANGRIL
jgi:hypothetical protein